MKAEFKQDPGGAGRRFSSFDFRMSIKPVSVFENSDWSGSRAPGGAAEEGFEHSEIEKRQILADSKRMQIEERPGQNLICESF